MSEHNHYIIELSRLPLGAHSFDFQLDNDFFSTIDKSEILQGQVAATAALNLREDDYSLTIAVRGTVFVICDRCLDQMPVEIDDEQDVNDEQDMTIDGSPRLNTIDLTWLAYEIVCINLPLVHCHPAGGCNPQMDALLQQHLCSTAEEPEDTNEDIE